MKNYENEEEKNREYHRQAIDREKMRRKRRRLRQRRQRQRYRRRIIILEAFGVLLAICFVLSSIHRIAGSKNPAPEAADSNENSKSKVAGQEDNINSTITPMQTAAAGSLESFQNSYGQDSNTTSYTVCLDAGHGGDDVGAEGPGGICEKEQTLALAHLVKEYLESAGIHVVMTRTGDDTLSLKQRRNIAENCHADLLLSIHRNAYEGTADVNGIEAWLSNTRPQDAISMSTSILNNIEAKVTGFNNRGVKFGSMDDANENYGMNKVSMTSMILELGFITSEHDNEFFRTSLDEIAQGIAEGVIQEIIQN